MFDAVQEIIDRLAASLRRSAALLDADMSLVANSRHFDDIDPAQITLLTTRAIADSLRESVGTAARSSVVVVDEDPGGGIRFPRMLLTLRSRAEVLGYMFITLPTPLTPSEYLSALEAGDVLSHLVENASRSIEDVNLEVEAEMMALLTNEESSRVKAAEELMGLGMFSQSRHFVSLCIAFDVEWGPWDGPPAREVITRIVARAITTPRIDAYGFVPTAPESFVLIGFQRSPSRDALHSIVSGLVAELARGRGGDPVPGRIGASAEPSMRSRTRGDRMTRPSWRPRWRVQRRARTRTGWTPPSPPRWQPCSGRSFRSTFAPTPSSCWSPRLPTSPRC